MRPGMKGRHLEANIFMARRVFKRDVLRILLSEFHAPLEKHSLGIKESGASPMSVVITDPYDCGTGFVT